MAFSFVGQVFAFGTEAQERFKEQLSSFLMIAQEVSEDQTTIKAAKDFILLQIQDQWKQSDTGKSGLSYEGDSLIDTFLEFTMELSGDDSQIVSEFLVSDLYTMIGLTPDSVITTDPLPKETDCSYWKNWMWYECVFKKTPTQRCQL